MLLGYKNLHYEPNSHYSFDELNESEFIKKIFLELRELMGISFFDYEFFIFSNHDVFKKPHSVNVQLEKKKVLLYFSDERGQNPSDFSDEYFAVFKSYLPKDTTLPNVFPLSLGYVKDVPEVAVVPFEERVYNVFFSGNLNTNRIDFYRSLTRLKYLIPSGKFVFRSLCNLLLRMKSDFSSYFPDSIIKFNGKFRSGISPAKYGEILVHSKVALCPKGFSSPECFRHYESMRAGCIVVSEKLPDNELYRNSPIIQVDNWDQGLEIVRDLLKNENQMKEIHYKTLEWWENKLSERATAKYITSCLASLNE
jgi:hypothetical protein